MKQRTRWCLAISCANIAFFLTCEAGMALTAPLSLYEIPFWKLMIAPTVVWGIALWLALAHLAPRPQ